MDQVFAGERLHEDFVAGFERRLLIENGIEPHRIQAFGKGEANPIADNSTEAGQAINRRAEFVFKRQTAIQ